jgi:hypothetical protein
MRHPEERSSAEPALSAVKGRIVETMFSELPKTAN